MIGNIDIIRQFAIKVHNTIYTNAFLNEIQSMINNDEQAFREELSRCNFNKNTRYWDVYDQIYNFKWDVDQYNRINLGCMKMKRIEKDFPVMSKIMKWRWQRNMILPREEARTQLIFE